MNIREAILKAADQIDRSPESFNFGASTVPHTCNWPGCALGWIGHFLGGFSSYSRVDHEVFGLNDIQFYQRITDLEVGPGGDWPRGTWPRDAHACARALRLYADKYHPAPTGIPDSVRDIFSMTPAQLGEVLANA